MQQTRGKKYYGFDLASVCWGYRDIFRKLIEELYEKGALGQHNEEMTRRFFAALKSSEGQLFDHVLKSFLDAVAGESAWIFDLPTVFDEVIETGFELARSKLYYGISFFRILGEGGFGRTPGHVHHLITGLKRLRAVDDELAFSYLQGYAKLYDRLSPEEIDLYLTEGIRVFERSRKSGLDFMAVNLKSSEAVIQSLSHECRLQNMRPSMEKLLKALSGIVVEIDDLSRLDSDELIERGSRVVALYRWLYVPQRIRYFEAWRENRSWYLLETIVAGAMLAFSSFPRIHGHPEYGSSAGLVGPSLARQNLFAVFEYARVLRRAAKHWPGAERLIRFGLNAASAEEPTPAERLFADLMALDSTHRRPAPGSPDGRASSAAGASAATPVPRLLELVDSAVNAFDTASLLSDDLVRETVSAYPGLDIVPLPGPAFLPDFSYPAGVSSPPPGSLVADMKSRAERARRRREGQDAQKAFEPEVEAAEGDSPESEEEERAGESVDACYVYDEWCQSESDYYPDYCRVYEKRFESRAAPHISEEILAEAKRIRRIFELIKPEIARREKYLADGEIINEDLLLDYLVLRRKEPSPEVRFFEKPLIRRRDLAVMVLLDVSGSTGELSEQRRVIDIEKNAALILGQGLSALGDRFAICGFSGNGRENCRFVIFKDFAEPWNRESRSRLFSAWPMNSTRIGAALRHAGYRLSRIEARQRLIILITDGKPSDTAYDPVSRYAQHDVRMACEENRRLGIVTFGISTQENSLTDMEIMFPQRRFAILRSIDQLTRVLPRLYLKMTV